MNGFDTEFKDLRDFILKITYRIWEEGGIDRIREIGRASCRERV